MRPSDKIERLIQETNYTADPVKREQILNDASQALRQSRQEPSSAKSAFWRTIMMYPLTKYAVAAFIVTAAGLLNYHYTGSVDMATIAFADISKAMKQVPWMHQVSRGFENGVNGQAEQWIGFEAKVHAAKWANGKVIFWDIREGRRYEYDPNSRQITTTIPDMAFPLDASSPAALLEGINKMVTEQGATIVSRTENYNGQTVQVQDISLAVNQQTQTMSLYIHPATKLLLKANIKTIGADNSILADGEAVFDYPSTGPASIYDLGVPRDIKPEQCRTDIVLQGRLVDASGNGTAGTVAISWSHIIQTDQQGLFAVPQSLSKDIYGNLHVCYALNENKTLGKAFLWKTGKAKDIQVSLEPLISICGRTVDTNGKPVKNADIRLGIETNTGGYQFSDNPPWEKKIRSDGTFCFKNVPIGAKMEVLAESPGLQGSVIIPQPQTSTDVNAGDIVLKPLAGFETETTWDAVLSGCITNEKGQPMPGLRVAISSMGTKVLEGKTNRKGRFAIKGLPRDKKISGSVWAQGYGHTMFKTKCDESELNLQLFPQGYELLNKPAPGLFAERWLNTEPVTLEQFRGKVVLLQIGVMLPLYQRPFETIENINKKYGGQGLGVIVLHARLTNDWAGPVTEEDILKFIKEHNIQFPFGIDDDKEKVKEMVTPDKLHNGAMYSLYSVKATPAMYLIDKKGLVRISPTDENLEQWVKALLSE